ncbi:hypothetical protein [Rhodococcus sp. RDE2]|uniref:hypothetical protein n=1 Tax=Rhodococcus sp. RDE2 TaxID=2885078 RepID=UPI001E2F54FE|nr:hypothetical protein [Rhodococcus sp. RDE2]BDB63543.1 hypothetical protein RDE2_53370 [Rhodococcus sp. RDE2]
MSEVSQVFSDALELLRRAGIRVLSGSLETVELGLPDGRELSAAAMVHRRPPTPSALAGLCSDPAAVSRPLVVAPRATAHLRRLASRGQMDVIGVDEGLIVFDGVRYRPDGDSPRQTPAARVVRGRRPWVRWALERLLLVTGVPVTQRELASMLEVSQQAVSLALRQCRHVHRTADGWVAGSRADLLSEHLADYPGPGGATMYWYGLDPVVAQATAVVEFCSGQGAAVLVSGDPAADVYAPWRLPTRAVLYTDQFVDLAPAGFAPATAAEHTLALRVPADPTLWRTAAAAGEPVLLADPVITVHDVLRGPGADVQEAAEHLLTAIREGAL